MEDKPNKTMHITVVSIVVLLVIAAVVIILVRHNNSNSLSPSKVNADKQQIESNWKEFFAASTPNREREDLLQNGSEFSQPIESEFSALGSQASSAVISSISITNSTSANVNYDVDLNGQAVLTKQKGEALLLNNTWKVSDSTLCGLLSMGGDKPSVCKNF